MAVDEDQTTRQEEDRSQNEQQQQEEQDETLQDQQQQEEEVEEENASEAWKEDLMLLLEPFSKEQLHGIVKQVAKRASNFFYKHSGVNLEEEEDLDLQDKRVEKYVEPLSRRTLKDFLIVAAENDLPTRSLVCQVASQAANVNPGHHKILVQSHGFRWDATRETLSSVFSKYGEITEIEVCKNITKKTTGYAFISFKHWSGACKALKNRLNKVGNRWTVCDLASSRPSGLALTWLESANNSEEFANNVIEECLKGGNCPMLQFSRLKLVSEPLVETQQILYHRRVANEYNLVRKLHQWLHSPVNPPSLAIPVIIKYGDPAAAAMNYPTNSGCNRDT